MIVFNVYNIFGVIGVVLYSPDKYWLLGLGHKVYFQLVSKCRLFDDHVIGPLSDITGSGLIATLIKIVHWILSSWFLIIVFFVCRTHSI